MSRLHATWRPLVGWVGVGTLAWQGIAHPVLTWVMVLLGVAGQAPAHMPSDLLLCIVGATLGAAGLRSYDKVKGTDPKA